MISAECGLPTFRPSTTLGFDIETIDYTDEDIGNLRRRRVLTSTDLNRELEQTNNEYFLNMYLENEEIEALSKIIKT
jgi:NAD-dependent SIR2 family protein deacetylase